MATVKVDRNWIRFQQACLLVPKQLLVDMKAVLTSELKGVKQQMVASVSGAVLKRVSGRLASSIKSRVRVFNQSKVWGRVGTKYYVGRMWEGGMSRRKKSIPPKSWAGPVISANINRIAGVMQNTVDRTIEKGGL